MTVAVSVNKLDTSSVDELIGVADIRIVDITHESPYKSNKESGTITTTAIYDTVSVGCADCIASTLDGKASMEKPKKYFVTEHMAPDKVYRTKSIDETSEVVGTELNKARADA